MTHQELNRIIDFVLNILDTRTVNLIGPVHQVLQRHLGQSYLTKENADQHDLIMYVIAEMGRKKLLIQQPNFNTIMPEGHISPTGLEIKSGGGWLKHLATEEFVKQRAIEIQDLQIEESRRNIKLAKWFWPVLIITNILNFIITVVASNFQTVLGWFK